MAEPSPAMTMKERLDWSNVIALPSRGKAGEAVRHAALAPADPGANHAGMMPPRLSSLRPIGLLRTPFRTLPECPRNGRQPNPPPPCEAQLFPEFGPGLASLDGFSHLILVYWLDRVQEPSLVVTPPFDPAPRGIFATRSPRRPNPIGMSVVAFDGFADPLTLRVRYLDCVDGTPLLDIKPYLPSTDSVPDANMGWLAPYRTG